MFANSLANEKLKSLHLTFSWPHSVALLSLICQGQQKTGVNGTDCDCSCVSHSSGCWSAQLVTFTSYEDESFLSCCCCPCHLPSIYTPCLRKKEKKGKLGPTLDFLGNMLCCMGIMEALGANSFHVSLSSVLDKEQPVAEMSSEDSHMTSCTAAGRHTVRGAFFIVSPPPLHKELFIWVSQRDGESVCPLGSSLS